MPAPSPTATADLLATVLQGMHSGISPRLVGRNQVAFAVNTTFRNGLPKTRPVWVKQALSFPDDATRENASALFQVGSFYQGYGNSNSCLVAMIGGRLFRYDVSTTGSASVQDITPKDAAGNPDVNDPTVESAWMWQAEDFLIVQNGQALPYFFDGGGVRRSGGPAANELPTGCMGTYVQGRVWQVLPSAEQQPSQTYIAGDLVYSHGFSGPYNGRDAVLQTTELSLVPGGGPLSVPVAAGAITGMGTTAVMDTSLGQGSLLVHTPNSVFSINVPLDRTQWFSQNYPIVVVSLPNYGTVSQAALVTVNGDQWYRSLDGIRSYQVGRRDQGTWVSTPLSVEVDKILNRDTPQWMARASGVLFNNRYLVTCAPFVTEGRGTSFRGLVALDFNNVSNLTTRSQPCYDGLWTGVFVKQVVRGTFAGRERCFAWGIGCDGGIELWELLRDDAAYFDWDGAQSVRVESAIETRSMGWGDGGNVLKRLKCADIYIDRLAGNDEVDFTVKYKSDENPVWTDWTAFSLCAPITDCPTTGCFTPVDVNEQYRTYLRLVDPVDQPVNPVTGRSPRTGYEFQVRYEWTGYVQWNRFIHWTDVMSDSVFNAAKPGPRACVKLTGCEEPWFSYTVNGCGNVPPLPPPAPPSGDVPSIITEGGQHVVKEDNTNTGIRTEDQLPVPPGPTPPAPPIPVGPPSPHVPPNVAIPVWPIPDPLPCPGFTYANADGQLLRVVDTTTLAPGYVGVPDTGDPTAYIAANSNDPAGCIQAWANAVWLQFLTLGIPYSDARLEWQFIPVSGTSNYFGTVVFPDQGGVYNLVSDCPWRIVCAYCP